MIWSALSLTASLLLCAAVIFGQLAAGNVNSGSSLGQGAQAMQLRTKVAAPVASVGQVLHRFEMGEDALLVRVSTKSR
jgi:hypothetical protein